MNQLQPNWRSLLFVPVTSERFLSKAHTRGADAIILDLEDSILPARKAAARAALPAAVPRVAQGGADVVVRINRPLDLAVADIAASVMPGVAALMLPKVMGPEHVRLLAELVTDREAALGLPIGHTRFLALIELSRSAAAPVRHRGPGAHGRHVGGRRGHGDRTRRHPLGRQHVCLRHAGPGRGAHRGHPAHGIDGAAQDHRRPRFLSGRG